MQQKSSWINNREKANICYEKKKEYKQVFLGTS
jgi:hypothetical protein